VSSCAGGALGVYGDASALPKMIEADRRLGGDSRIKKGIDRLKKGIKGKSMKQLNI